MAINPNIALSGRSIELTNPLDQYSKFAAIQNAMADQERQNTLAPLQIEAARSTNALNQYNLQSKQAEDLRENEYRNALLNAKTPEDQLAVLGKYKPSDAIAARKILAEQAKADREGRLARSKLATQSLENARGFLATLDTSNPTAAASQAVRMFDVLTADPELSEDLKVAGYTSDVVRGMFARALETNSVPQLIQSMSVQADKFAELRAKTFQNTDLSGTVQTWETDKLGNRRLVGTEDKTLPPQPDPTSVKEYEYYVKNGGKLSYEEFKKLGASSTTVNVDSKGPAAYGQAVGKGTGEEDVKTYSTLNQASENIAKMDETLGVLRNQDVNTGLLAEVNTVLDKARGQYLNDEKAGKRVTSTEYLDTLLGSEVFPQISALGIGARGLDTPAEREFLRKVMTGTLPLNKDTLIKMTELRRKTLADRVEKFNKEVDSGRWDNFFTQSGYPKKKIEIPKASAPVSSGDQEALNWAKANPTDPRAAKILKMNGR